MLSPTHEMLIGMFDMVSICGFVRKSAAKLRKTIAAASATANTYVLFTVNLTFPELEFLKQCSLRYFKVSVKISESRRWKLRAVLSQNGREELVLSGTLS